MDIVTEVTGLDPEGAVDKLEVFVLGYPEG